MHAIEIENGQQYQRAMEVLIEVGGTFQGRGREKPVLLVTDAQYQALVAAHVVQPTNKKARNRGEKTAKNGKAQGTA